MTSDQSNQRTDATDETIEDLEPRAARGEEVRGGLQPITHVNLKAPRIMVPPPRGPRA